MATRHTSSTLAKGVARISKKIIFSYVLDWVFILIIAAIGAGFNQSTHYNQRPFSLQDPSITYPDDADTVTIGVLLVVVLVAPGIITAIVCLLFVPGRTVARGTPKALIWRRKLWEWNTAWLGLGLSLATAFMTTEGLKDLAGKPRPHMLAVCRPDLSAASIARYRLGGYGESFTTTGAVPIRVGAGICQETDVHALRDAFASWPSGHSSFSFAGLLYLTLFLCAKFAVGIPFVTTRKTRVRNEVNTFEDYSAEPSAVDTGRSSSDLTRHGSMADQAPPRNTAAAPPVYLLVLCIFVPIGTALFICVSRWFDFHHHGLDIFSGAVIGTITSYFSFRYYHMPIMRGSGWSWGARSKGRAFAVGIGHDGYVGDEGWTNGASRNDDIEVGKQNSSILGAGHADASDEHASAAHNATGAYSYQDRDVQRNTMPST